MCFRPDVGLGFSVFQLPLVEPGVTSADDARDDGLKVSGSCHM